MILCFSGCALCDIALSSIKTMNREPSSSFPPFRPPPGLRNRHIQTILASLKPRKLLARRRAAELLDATELQIIDCGNGIRLAGAFSATSDNNKKSNGLVILIHGWEGSIDSAYILSTAAYLFARGYNIFRLNLRDHGDSHHLNREPFASTRLTETVNAVRNIIASYPHPRTFLAGFSLGGNFALRIGMRLRSDTDKLCKIAAISPLIDPLSATRNLQQNHPIYHRYFVHKWKRSLTRKLEFFPDLGYGQALLKHHDLAALNGYFVPHHTSFPTPRDYLSAYAINQEKLSWLTVPAHIIAAGDDPITRKVDMDKLCPTANLTIERTKYGGHCGFLLDFRLTSWVDQRLAEIFNATTTSSPDNL